MNKLILLLFGLLVLPLVFASSINDTVIYGSNDMNLTFNVTRYYSNLLTLDGIYFSNYANSTSSNNNLTYNLTCSDVNYYVNSSQEDVPHFTNVNSGFATISVNTCQTNATVKFVANCGSTATGYVKNVTYTSGLGNYSTSYTSLICTGGVLSFSDVGLETGDNTFNLFYYTDETTSCVLGTDLLNDFIGIIGLIVLAVVLGSFYGFKKLDVDISEWQEAAVVIISLIVLIIFTMMIVQKLLGC